MNGTTVHVLLLTGLRYRVSQNYCNTLCLVISQHQRSLVFKTIQETLLFVDVKSFNIYLINFALVWFCLAWCGVFGYVSGFKFNFNAVKMN